MKGPATTICPPADYAQLAPELLGMLTTTFAAGPLAVYCGATWTTDAPFRETTAAINGAKAAEIWAVEMEAAALYAFAQARHRPVVCFAHVTNQMGTIEGDFEKGEADGSRDALALISATAHSWLTQQAAKAPAEV